ncbi:hypothetical protein [Sphingobium sp. CFD-2]|uniref:hypothetical protein n=1 Tax=Sphingobium sp. CFD-2 TaxID=2878542 RepID=UPI00214B8526|nr:hypothetical protein [Sphingobium sp. CFD-2]
MPADRAPVTITKYGQPDFTIDDAAYFERIERLAAGQILAVLDLQTTQMQQAGFTSQLSKLDKRFGWSA